MDEKRRKLAFLNVAHFIDHYVLLIFPTVVIGLQVELGRSYAELIALSTACFVAFGLFSLPAGWLGDHSEPAENDSDFLYRVRGVTRRSGGGAQYDRSGDSAVRVGRVCRNLSSDWCDGASFQYERSWARPCDQWGLWKSRRCFRAGHHRFCCFVVRVACCIRVAGDHLFGDRYCVFRDDEREEGKPGGT